MGKYDGVFLYTDIDGTLLDDRQRMSEATRAAIRAFVAEGGRFGVATGRGPANSAYYTDLLPVNAPCILFNGGGLYDLIEKRYLAAHPIDRGAGIALCRRAMALVEDVCVQVFTRDTVYEPNLLQLDDPLTAREKAFCPKTPVEQIPGEWMKVLLGRPADRLDALVKALDLPGYKGIFHTVQTAPVYEEFVAADAGKGAALSDLRRCVPGVTKILAIGDYYNDEDLVRCADLGAAPQNAVQAVKDAADLLLPVDNNDSAVAKFLELAL